MADTIPDFYAPNGSWIDVYTETGITSGATITITNKSSYEVLILEQLAQPLASVNDGKPISTINTGTYTATVSGSPTGVWLKSSGNSPALVNVQEV